MIIRNVEEYKLIRQEMINLKDCITKYIGYVFAGSGAMIYGLAKVNNSTSPLSSAQPNVILSPFPAEVTFIAASFSMLVSLVLLMLFYKFNSHNRFAGFCKLLNHERHELLTGQPPEQKCVTSEKDKEPPLFSWEITVGDLRWLESKPNYLGNIMKEISISEPTKRTLRERVEERIEINGKRPAIDSYKSMRGLSIIIKTILLRNTQTDSWGFPPLVVCIFLFIVAGFLGASVSMVLQIGFLNNPVLFSYVIAIFVLQLCLWWHISGKLFSLMNGSSTVYSFYWKFIPLRALFLNKQNPKIKPGYISIEEYIFSDSTKNAKGETKAQ
ncbi:MAG: hypothetical protein AB1711_03845 [Thermodesulfobacteriota bacterium]